MGITRRTLLVGAGSGAIAMLLASCTPPQPTPTPTAPTVAPTPSTDVPAPSGFLRSAWTDDPLSRGARAFVPVGVGEADRDVLTRPLLDRVFFAGEVLGDPVGTIEGARQDGFRAAAALTEVSETGERVFVVGAGVAGARAARFLVDAGYEVTVIEGRDRTGGRLHTAELDDWPVAPQLGAWLTPAESPALHARLEELGVELHGIEGEAARDDEGDTDVPTLDALTRAVEWAAEQDADPTLAEALAETGADPEDPAVIAVTAALAAASGADPDRLSGWYPPEIPEERMALTGDLNAFTEEDLDGIQVSLSTTVLGIAYDEDGISLRLSTGEALSADRVIVTAPIGVLQYGSIEFEPALPFPYRGAIAALGSGAIETVWLRFDEEFWTEDAADAALWHVVGGEAFIRTWINLAPVLGEPVLVGLVGGETARAFAELDDDEAAQAAVDSLAFFAS